MKTPQEKARDLKEEILLYVENANLEEALKLLLNLALLADTEKIQTVRQTKFQFKKIERENIEGILSRENYNLETNRIFKNVLSLVKTLCNEINEKRQVKIEASNIPERISPEANINNNIVFQCEDLGKSYKRTKFSLSNINLTIREGEIIAVAGANAVGKTTLLRLIASDLLPDYGTIKYPLLSDESKLNYSKIKQQIAYIPQEIPKWFGSLKNSIHFEAAMHGVKGEANEEAVKNILPRLGLEKYCDNSWAELSSGYKLRFHIAKALAWQPRLLILDEPLAFLDIKAQRIVLNDLRHLVKNGNSPLSLVLSTQHLREAEEVADYFIFLNDQRIIFHGDAKSINSNSETKIYEISTSASLEELNKVFLDLSCKISPLYRKVFILEVNQTVEHRIILSKLALLQNEVKHVIDITHSLKRFFL